MHKDPDVNDNNSQLVLLHVHLRARLDRPRRIEPLALRVFEQLHTFRRGELARDPLHRLLQTAIAVLCQTAPDDAHSASVLHAHVVRARPSESDTAVTDTGFVNA